MQYCPLEKRVSKHKAMRVSTVGYIQLLRHNYLGKRTGYQLHSSAQHSTVFSFGHLNHKGKQHIWSRFSKSQCESAEAVKQPKRSFSELSKFILEKNKNAFWYKNPNEFQREKKWRKTVNFFAFSFMRQKRVVNLVLLCVIH